MPFQKVQSPKIAERVTDQIEHLILNGILRPGQRLPSERELAERFGVSRPSVREAVAAMEEDGLLVSRANSGIFVADALNSLFSESLTKLFSKHERAIFDYIDFRRDIECVAADYVIKHGSPSDFEVVNQAFLRMEAAHSAGKRADEAQLDAEFHFSIIEAGHNVVMLHMMRAMYEMLANGVLFNRKAMFAQKTSRAELLDAHRRINDAIQARESEEAQRAIRDHLNFIKSALERKFEKERAEDLSQKLLISSSNR